MSEIVAGLQAVLTNLRRRQGLDRREHFRAVMKTFEILRELEGKIFLNNHEMIRAAEGWTIEAAKSKTRRTAEVELMLTRPRVMVEHIRKIREEYGADDLFIRHKKGRLILYGTLPGYRKERDKSKLPGGAIELPEALQFRLNTFDQTAGLHDPITNHLYTLHGPEAFEGGEEMTEEEEEAENLEYGLQASNIVQEFSHQAQKNTALLNDHDRKPEEDSETYWAEKIKDLYRNKFGISEAFQLGDNVRETIAMIEGLKSKTIAQENFKRRSLQILRSHADYMDDAANYLYQAESLPKNRDIYIAIYEKATEIEAREVSAVRELNHVRALFNHESSAKMTFKTVRLADTGK